MGCVRGCVGVSLCMYVGPMDMRFKFMNVRFFSFNFCLFFIFVSLSFVSLF